ncbi:carbon monoxide dehydrogenase subunit G [Pseudoxanthobacter sp. M-2]|uniref:SRPBCC family protein n=1 Tax=Pseudoxanthobacter sp. M-2 TaxID=3078754 RepID=UPI0038FC2058
MEMTGEYRIAAPRERVWAALNDPEVLKACIPGCESLEKTSDNEMTAAVTAKVGPVKAKFTGAVTLLNIRPPEGYTISGEGKGGVAGFAKGGADVALTEDGPDATILKYAAKAQVGGKLAQLGARLIDSTAKKMADDFFGAFAAKVAASSAATDGMADATAPASAALSEEDAEMITAESRSSIAPTDAPIIGAPGAAHGVILEAEHAVEDAEQKMEVAAGKGVLGGPVVWGLIALAVVIALLWAFN